MAQPCPHHRRANGNNTERVGRISGAEHEDELMRQRCIAGTKACRQALQRAGYSIGNLKKVKLHLLKRVASEERRGKKARAARSRCGASRSRLGAASADQGFRSRSRTT